MKVGADRVEITPDSSVDLSGFVARSQPSMGILDPIYARALYMESGSGARLLWVLADLLAFDRGFVERFQTWAAAVLRLEPPEVLLSTTHTHSAPATCPMMGCGEYEAAYVERLDGLMRQAARGAVAAAGPATLVAGESLCDLAVDRRRKASAHVDPRVAALAWQRADGTYAAVLGNYPIHNVSLGPSNRRISGDITGRAAATLERTVPGLPIALMTVGGAGNLNPPQCGVPVGQMQEWGDRLAQKVRDALEIARPLADRLRVRAAALPVPLNVLDARSIARRTEETIALATAAPQDIREHIAIAAHQWQKQMTGLLERGEAPASVQVEIAAVSFDDVHFVGLNAEVFSRMADDLRRLTHRSVCVVGCTGGVFGYLPTPEAFAEGGYEPEQSPIYYGRFPLKPEAFDLVARRAAELLTADD